MPRLSAFYGIVIYMHLADHNPPHFHARYAGRWARFDLRGEVIEGRLPRRARRLIKEWAELHIMDLVKAWDLAVRREPPGTIDPLP